MKVEMGRNSITLQFAKEELIKYIDLIDGNVSDDFSIFLDVAKDDKEKDSYSIDISENGGKIIASNERSVLFGVYAYLEKLGVRFIRPGKDGEYLPSGINVKNMPVKLSKTAANRYRTMCIEGAVSIENMLENIDWCAKIGMNGYYLQFMIPTTFFDRWYSHIRNPLLEGRSISEEEAKDFKKQMVDAIKKRGLEFHSCGHGWTSAPYNLPANGWDKYKGEVDEEIKKDFALVNGKRELWTGIPLNTELCYSKASVRKRIADFCVSYIKKNPEIDVVHFTFSDGLGNQCECDDCSKYRPSEYMVMILNEVDERLTKDGIDTKITVTLYHELLWPPQQVKLNDSARFLLLFCPITRTYGKSYSEMGEAPAIRPYERNKGDYPKSVEENYTFLDAWQKVTTAKGFTFEYYYWTREHYSDFGSINLANVVYEDIKMLDKMSLAGMVSCQSQRSLMPTGLGSYVMAKALFDDEPSFEEIMNEYFDATYGEYSSIFFNHFSNLSKLAEIENVAEKFTKVKEQAEKMQVKLTELAKQSNGCHKLSLDYVSFHCKLLIKTAEAELATIEKGYDDAIDYWRELVDFIRRTELEVQPVFDVYQYLLDLYEFKHTELKKYKL